jgi:hypothetical protein
MNLFIAIWGAGLSTILAAITIWNFFKESKVKFIITGMIESPFTKLRIYVFNNGSKAASITSFSIGIGESSNNQQEIWKEELPEEKNLEYPAQWIKNVESDSIIESYKQLNRKRNPYELLWLNIFLTSRKRLTRAIYIDPSIIPNPFYEKAEAYIAADIFLGLPQQASEIREPFIPIK